MKILKAKKTLNPETWFPQKINGGLAYRFGNILVCSYIFAQQQAICMQALGFMGENATISMTEAMQILDRFDACHFTEIINREMGDELIFVGLNC